MTTLAERQSARAKVRYAVRTDKLTRLPCAVCGKPKVQAHHANGYHGANALDVVWLCLRHHVARHNETKAKEMAWAQSLIDQVAARQGGAS